MAHLSITPDEATLVRELLQVALLELRREIWHTDTREFRQGLVQRQRTIEHLIEAFQQHERELQLQ
jgi:tRNA pseudouridine-54 N-methylase